MPNQNYLFINKNKMELTYNNYPLLLFFSFDKNNAPEYFPFEVVDVKTKEYLQNCKGFQEFFAFIPAKNGFSQFEKHNNYLISDSLYFRIDSADYFRQTEFEYFFSTYIKPATGTICFKDGGQYVYMLLSKGETKKLKNRDGRYIAVALFKENTFVGFEEAYILEKGLEVLHTGYYETGMDKGGFLSFVIVFLSYLHKSNTLNLLDDSINKTTEKIFLVE